MVQYSSMAPTMLRFWCRAAPTARGTGNLVQRRPFGCGHFASFDVAHLIECGMLRDVSLALIQYFATELACGAAVADVALQFWVGGRFACPSSAFTVDASRAHLVQQMRWSPLVARAALETRQRGAVLARFPSRA